MLPRAAAAIAALAITTTGCAIVDDAPKKPDGSARPSTAEADCAGYECRVRVTCRGGRRYVRIGPAPVRVTSNNAILQTRITVDFAGSRDDSVIRC